MSDEEKEVVEKTPLEKSNDLITQLKEMLHYSKANIERLTAVWLQLDDELKQKATAKEVEVLLTQQNTFHDSLEKTIDNFEVVCKAMEGPAAT